MDELLEILSQIDELTGKINDVFENADIPAAEKFNEIKNIFSELIGQDAVRAINDFTEQFRSLNTLINESKSNIQGLVSQMPDLERNFRPFIDLLDKMQSRNQQMKIEQLLTGDLEALKFIEESGDIEKRVKLGVDIDYPSEEVRQIFEQYQGSPQLDILIEKTRREKLKSYYDNIQSEVGEVSDIFKPIKLAGELDFGNFSNLTRESARLSDAFDYFRDKLRTASDLSLRTTESLRMASKELEVAANKQLQQATLQYGRGEIDKGTYDIVARQVEEAVARINSELPKELRIRLLDEDILKSKEIVTPDIIAKAAAEGKVRQSVLSPETALNVTRDISQEISRAFNEKLSAFTLYREKLGVTGYTNDPFSAMMFIGMSFQQEVNPALERFQNNIRQFDTMVQSSTPFKRQARNEAELLVNQKALEAFQLRETRINEANRLLEEGKLNQTEYNRVVREADVEFKRLMQTLRRAQLSFNMIASREAGLRPIGLVSEEQLREKAIRGETRFTVEELRGLTEKSRLGETFERLQAELYQGAIGIRNAFAKITANLLMNTMWSVSFTVPMALMNSLIFEPYMRTRSVLEPAFTGIGQATGVPQVVGQITNFVGGGFIQLANDIFDKLSALTAIYRSPQTGQQVIQTALQIARYQPIQFGEATELLRAFAIFPGTRAAIGTREESRRQLLDVAQYLQMLSPEQGIGGAIIALREFFSGEFRSMRMRFEIDPESLAAMAGVTTGEMLSAPADKKIEMIYTALSNLLGKEALFYKAANVEFQVQNLTDVLQQTIAQSFATEPVPILSAYYYQTEQGGRIRESMRRELEQRGYAPEEIEQILSIRLRLRQTLNGAIAGIIEDFNNIFSKYLTSTSISSRASNFLARFIIQIQESLLSFERNIDVGRPDALRVFVRQISQALVNMINSLENEFENNPDIQAVTEAIGTVVSKMVQKIFASTTQIVGQTIASSIVELPSTFYGIMQGLFKATIKTPTTITETLTSSQQMQNSEIAKYLWKPINETSVSASMYEQNTFEATATSVSMLAENAKQASENLRQFNNVLTLLATAVTPGGLVGKSAAFLGFSTVQGAVSGSRLEGLLEAGTGTYIGYMLARLITRKVSNLPEGISRLGMAGGLAGIAGIEYLKYQQGQSLTQTAGNLLIETSLLTLVTQFGRLREAITPGLAAGASKFAAERAAGSGLARALSAGLRGALTGVLAAPVKHPYVVAGAALIGMGAGIGLSYFGAEQQEEKIKQGQERIRQAILQSIESWLNSLSNQARELAKADTSTFYAKLKGTTYENIIEPMAEVGFRRQIPAIVSEQFTRPGGIPVSPVTIARDQIFGDTFSKVRPETIFKTFQTIVDSVAEQTNRLVQILQSATKGEQIDMSKVQEGVQNLQDNLIEIRNQIFQQVLIQNPNLSAGEANQVANNAVRLVYNKIIESAVETVKRNAEYLRRFNENVASNPDVIRKLFVNEPVELKLPRLELDLSGNINQQIKAFVTKVNETFTKSLDSYVQSLQVTEQAFTFGDKLNKELEDLNDKIINTLDNVFKRITDVGRKLGFITPEQEYGTLKLKEQMARRLETTNPEAALNRYLSLAEEYYKFGDIQSAFRTYQRARMLTTAIPGEVTEDFRRRYMMTAPPEVRSIPAQYLQIAQNVSQYDAQAAIKYAMESFKTAQRYGDTATMQQSYNFLQRLLTLRGAPAREVLERGGRLEYIRGELQRVTQPGAVTSAERRQLSALQMIDSSVRQNLRQLGTYSFPLTRRAIVSLDANLASNIRSTSTGGKATEGQSQKLTAEAFKESLINQAFNPQQQGLKEIESFLNVGQVKQALKEIEQSGEKSGNTIKKVVDEAGNTIYKIQEPLKVSPQEGKPQLNLPQQGYQLQIPDLERAVNSLEQLGNGFVNQFLDISKPNFLWKASTSDWSMMLTQQKIGEITDIQPRLMPNLGSINFFGMQAPNVLPQVSIPRDIVYPTEKNKSIMTTEQYLAYLQMPQEQQQMQMPQLVPDVLRQQQLPIDYSKMNIVPEQPQAVTEQISQSMAAGRITSSTEEVGIVNIVANIVNIQTN